MAKPAELKTKETGASVEDFLNSLEEEEKREDAFTLLKLLQKITKEKPRMWGSAMIGFGNKRYKSPATGREVDWFRIGFAPRKANFSLYLISDLKVYAADLEKLGRHKTGGGCLYINKLKDIDLKVLEKMIQAAVKGK